MGKVGGGGGNCFASEVFVWGVAWVGSVWVGGAG